MKVELLGDASQRRVAVVYQRVTPPVLDGVRKDPKPGGYSDSGADIAFSLRQSGIDVVTPSDNPDPATDFDWVFPDTADGLLEAKRRGADTIWANTVLFRGHPLEAHLADFWIVGQLPQRQQEGDDKFATNARLRKDRLPVAASMLVGETSETDVLGFLEVTGSVLEDGGLHFPLVVKPVRGRGSQGVSLVNSMDEFRTALSSIFESKRFGTLAIAEEYLPERELTVSVMAPSTSSQAQSRRTPFVLPPVVRFNHQNGIAPYNGVVAVTTNSCALSVEQCSDAKVATLMSACADTFLKMGALSPIRIDCRANSEGDYKIFDVNMKPNMTGAGRPGREDQDSLTAIAARAIDWSYSDLLRAMLQSAWRAVAN
jgi:D-alanine-D-alanine ligase